MKNENTIDKTVDNGRNGAERTRSGCCYRPNVDILEQADELLVLADVPGANGDDIDVRDDINDAGSIEGSSPRQIKSDAPPKSSPSAMLWWSASIPLSSSSRWMWCCETSAPTRSKPACFTRPR